MWPTYAALFVLAVIGPVLAQNNPGMIMAGVSSRRSSMSSRRMRPVRVRPTARPSDDQPRSGALRSTPVIHFPTNLMGMFDDPAIVALPGVEEERPIMDMMDDMDVDKMGMDNLRMLNSMSTIEEFAAMYGVEVPVANNSSGSGIAARFGPTSENDVELPQAMCMPENRTVKLDLPKEENVMYIPNCVRLQRCGGCCIGSMLECSPMNTEAINIKVMRVASSTTTRTRSSGPDRGRQRPGSEGRAASRRRRRNIAEIIKVPEEQHIDCTCQCKVQKEDCHPIEHEYISENCKCMCKNSEEMEKCSRKSMTHYWNHDECRCFCLKIETCTVTLQFDHSTCSCVQEPQTLTSDNPIFTPRAGFTGSNGLDDTSERFRRDRIPVVFGRHNRRQARDVQDTASP